MSIRAERRILTDVLENQTVLVQDSIHYGMFEVSDISNLVHVDGSVEVKDISTWYLITEELASILHKHGYVVLSNHYGIWLGIEHGDSLFDINEELVEIIQHA